MGKYFVDFKETAKMEIAKIKKSGDLATFKKLEKIIIELSDHPTSGIGNPEQLKHRQLFYNMSYEFNR